MGGGPAGVILGLMLARAGVRVTVLEAQTSFERQFRGNTLNPAVPPPPFIITPRPPPPPPPRRRPRTQIRCRLSFAEYPRRRTRAEGPPGKSAGLLNLTRGAWAGSQGANKGAAGGPP